MLLVQEEREVKSLAYPHRPVLVEEVLAQLDPHPEGVVVDATLGAGGHAEAILKASSPSGRLLGLDRDEGALGVARARLHRFGDRIRLRQGSFADLSEHLDREGFTNVNGIVADLGLSSFQLEQSGKGFSFQKDEFLDMRADGTTDATAFDIVNTFSFRPVRVFPN